MRTINVQQILGSVNIAANAYLKNRFAMTMTEIHSVQTAVVMIISGDAEITVTRTRKCVEITPVRLASGKLAVTNAFQLGWCVMEISTVQMVQMRKIVKPTPALRVMLNVGI